NHFNAKHIVSIQFIAALAAGALSELQQLRRVKENPHSLPTLFTEPAVQVKPVQVFAPVSQSTAVAPKTAPKILDSDAPQPGAAYKLPAKPVEQRGNEPSGEVAPSGSFGFAERRSRPRTPVDCLAYVSLEENGGILLDISDAGFSVQAALPL